MFVSYVVHIVDVIVYSALAQTMESKRVTRPVDPINGSQCSLNGGQLALSQRTVKFASRDLL